MTEPHPTPTRGDELRAEAARNAEDARRLLAGAERLTDVSTDYRSAARKARLARDHFESAARLMLYAEDADVLDNRAGGTR